MRMFLLASLCLWSLGGCATVNPTVAEPSVEAELTRFEAMTPAIVQGERIHTAQQAVYIADLVLAMQGVNMKGRQYKVSFCEGVYEVTFSPGHSDPNGHYSVHIAAADSKVLSVRLLGPTPVGSLRQAS